jgi:hypothetical protein
LPRGWQHSTATLFLPKSTLLIIPLNEPLLQEKSIEREKKSTWRQQSDNSLSVHDFRKENNEDPECMPPRIGVTFVPCIALKNSDFFFLWEGTPGLNTREEGLSTI